MIHDDLIRDLSQDPARYWGVTIGVNPERLDEFWRDVAGVMMKHLDAASEVAYRNGFDDARNDHRAHECCGRTDASFISHDWRDYDDDPTRQRCALRGCGEERLKP